MVKRPWTKYYIANKNWVFRDSTVTCRQRVNKYVLNKESTFLPLQWCDFVLRNTQSRKWFWTRLLTSEAERQFLRCSKSHDWNPKSRIGLVFTNKYYAWLLCNESQKPCCITRHRSPKNTRQSSKQAADTEQPCVEWWCYWLLDICRDTGH